MNIPTLRMGLALQGMQRAGSEGRQEAGSDCLHAESGLGFREGSNPEADTTNTLRTPMFPYKGI